MGFLIALKWLHELDKMESFNQEMRDHSDRTINCNPSDTTVSSDDADDLNYYLDVCGFIVSFLALCLISVAILSDKRVRESHPNKIIAYICLCDAYNYY